MIKISVTNPILTDEERTYLTVDYSSSTNLYVANNEGFTVDWIPVIGEPGQEKTESQIVSAMTGNDTVVVDAALKFSHAKSTSIYLSQWDKISFERKPSGGSFAEISGSPFAIEWDNANLETQIVVSDGATTDTYRWRFYNSALGTYSDYSDTLAGTGFTRYTAGYVLQQVRKNPVSESVDDETIFSYMNDYQLDVVYPELPKAWWFTKEGTAISTVASTRTYSISTNWSDLISMKYLLYRYVNGETDITYPLTWSPTSEFYNLKSDANQSTDDYAKYWSLLPPDDSSAKGYIALHPIPTTTACYIKPVYFFELSDMNTYGDSLVVPYPKGYIDYVLYRIYDDIKNDSNADRYNSRVQRSMVYLKRLARRQIGQPEFFKFRGHRGWSQLFGEQGRLNSSESAELYW